jgi:branched-chain amino acid transport system substrate-binding protein
MRRRSLLLTAALPWLRAGAAQARDPGVSDSEILLGCTLPLSGPVSSASAGHEVLDRYLDKVNQSGGVAGRKLKLITLDDGYSPSKTVEQTRKLVEEVGVFAMVGSVGTPTNAAVQKYLNARKVPQSLILTGASRFNDPKTYPYTIPLLPNYNIEAQIYGRYLLKVQPDARIGVLYQDDDLGKDYMNGLRKGLGQAGEHMIVATVTYQTSDPDIDSQLITLKESKADTAVLFSTQKAGAQAIQRTFNDGWKTRIVNSIPAGRKTLRAAGLNRAAGIVSARVQLDADEDVPAAHAYLEFLKQWSSNTEPDNGVPYYILAQAVVRSIRRLGDIVTRENYIGQIIGMRGQSFEMLSPDVVLEYTPTDYTSFRTMRLARFDGSRWQPLKELGTTDADP